MDEVRINEDT